MCVWPAEVPSIQPGLGNLLLPFSIPIPLPAIVTFCAWSCCPVPRHIPMHSKENKNKQLNIRTDFSNMWLSTCFFQVLGDFFPSWGRQELLRELPVSHSAFLTTMGSAASFPQEQEYFWSPCSAPFPPQPLHSPRLHLWPCPGCHIPAGCSGQALSHPQGFLQPTPAFGACPTGISLWPGPGCALDAVIGHCQADVVVVACQLIVGGAADGQDAVHSQLIHGELVGINHPSVPGSKNNQDTPRHLRGKSKHR